MLFRHAMILVLVVWLLVGWVHSNQGGIPDPYDRDRRMHLRKRMLERMALRGYGLEESERLAEELLARLDSQPTSTSRYQSSRHQRDHHRSLERHSSPISHEPIYPEMNLFNPFEVLQEEEDVIESQAAAQPEIEVALEMEEAKDIIASYGTGEPLLEKSMKRRHTAEEALTRDLRRGLFAEEIQQPETTTRRPSREERRRLKEEKRRKKEEKKRKRANKKNKKRRKEQQFENELNEKNIPIYEVDGEKFFTCCPSKLVLNRKVVGKAKDNLAMEIKEGHRTFFERVCLEEYEGQPCIFPANSLKKGVVTRCVQEWSYSQAFTRHLNTTGEFMVDFVKVRSGCSCQVSLTHKKRKRKR